MYWFLKPKGILDCLLNQFFGVHGNSWASAQTTTI
jgi:hypothetical protein